MTFYTGSSGFSYKEWKGNFYPAEIRDGDMLKHYASRLPAVEINNTFYRMPRSDVVARWASEVPGDFRFVLKASRRITHQARLVDAGDSLRYLWQASGALGAQRGPFLFQTPPTLRCDLSRLQEFLAEMPEGMLGAFEFRHPSWVDDRTFAALSEGNHAWCVADSDADEGAALVATADWGYLRLRRSEYDADALLAWAERIAAQNWQHVYVFFKHEDEGAAPALALRLKEMLH